MWRSKTPYENQLYKYKILVPTYPPENAIDDNEGRKWVRQEDSGVDYYAWEGDFWFVWFPRRTAPQEGDVVFDKTVNRVYRYRNIKRAVVEFHTV